MKVTRAKYRKDKLYPKVTRAVHEILQGSKVVAPVEVLIHIGYLDKKGLEDWRRGRIPYLERVIGANLAKLQRILRILRLHAEDRGLKPTHTVYRKWGKGCKHDLRFSKTGNPSIEKLYSTHYVAGAGKAKGKPDESQKGSTDS